jgi:hypothetical protein
MIIFNKVLSFDNNITFLEPDIPIDVDTLLLWLDDTPHVGHIEQIFLPSEHRLPPDIENWKRIDSGKQSIFVKGLVVRDPAKAVKPITSFALRGMAHPLTVLDTVSTPVTLFTVSRDTTKYLSPFIESMGPSKKTVTYEGLSLDLSGVAVQTSLRSIDVLVVNSSTHIAVSVDTRLLAVIPPGIYFLLKGEFDLDRLVEVL